MTSSMFNVKVSRFESVTLHEQVAAEIRRAIANGEVKPGDRLPPAVDMAAVLGVNKNTVIRALHVLRHEGLLDFTRGRGIQVCGTVDRASVVEEVERLLAFARKRGYRKDDVLEMVRESKSGEKVVPAS